MNARINAPAEGPTVRVTSKRDCLDVFGNVCPEMQVVLEVEGHGRFVFAPDLAFKLGESLQKHARRITFAL